MSRPLQDTSGRERLPEWLHKSLSPGQQATKTDALIKDLGLHTICESGRCPNRNECYSLKTATFMIMGDICTRSCRFCSVSSGRPDALDADEPQRVGEAVKRLGLEHVVVTSVNRDDLNDEGAMHFVRVIEEIKKISQDIIIEILTPDFKRTQVSAVELILNAEPHIFNHNVETIPRLYTRVRPQADYITSLQIFREMKARSERILAKSGLMVGMGETEAEVLQVIKDLRSAGCDILTVGQYLRSSKMGIEVEEYVRPEQFLTYKNEALAIGFGWVESGPFVRSSFHAKATFESLKKAIHQKNLTNTSTFRG